MAWKAMDPLSAISDDSSDDSEVEVEESGDNKKICLDRQEKEKVERNESGKNGASVMAPTTEVKLRNKKAGLEFADLSRHGYTGGPSIMHVPAPKDEVDPNWSSPNGKRKIDDSAEESVEKRAITKEIVTVFVKKTAAQAIAEAKFLKKQKKDVSVEQRILSFSQKEKRKRDLGQSTGGKNYVEEEKRHLREQGVYSGFD